FALLGERRYGLDPAGLGLVFVYVGAIVAAVQGWLVGRLASACGERELAMTGAVVMGVALVALPLSASLGLALAALGALAVGQGLVTPALSSLLSRGSGADVQGSTLGLGQSFAAGARAVGPLVAGWLFDLGAPLPYLLGAALVLVVAWLVGAAGAPPTGALASEGARDR
ncbi:MAG TPA: MFS transporter, partial [Chloroflexota bacterium]